MTASLPTKLQVLCTTTVQPEATQPQATTYGQYSTTLPVVRPLPWYSWLHQHRKRDLIGRRSRRTAAPRRDRSSRCSARGQRASWSRRVRARRAQGRRHSSSRQRRCAGETARHGRLEERAGGVADLASIGLATDDAHFTEHRRRRRERSGGNQTAGAGSLGKSLFEYLVRRRDRDRAIHRRYRSLGRGFDRADLQRRGFSGDDLPSFGNRPGRDDRGF